MDSKPGIDAEAIRTLSDHLEETGLTEIEIEHDGAAHSRRPCRSALATLAAAPVAPAPGSAASAAAGTSSAPAPRPAPVASPMVGTVYLAPEPGKPSLSSSVGQQVKEGETLLIVEAMKTMNPIPRPTGGMVKEICVENATPVEFGQPLLIDSRARRRCSTRS